MRDVRVLWVAGLLTAVLGSCARPGPPAPAAPPCQSPAAAILSDTVGSLDETSSGAFCLAVGQAIGVFLHAKDAPNNRWAPIASSDPAILMSQRTGILTAAIGVTPGVFGGLKPGTVTLHSTDHTGQSWTVTITVS